MHSDPETVQRFWSEIEEDRERALEEDVEGKAGRVELADLKSSLYGATIEGGWPKPIVLAHEPSEEVCIISYDLQ